MICKVCPPCAADMGMRQPDTSRGEEYQCPTCEVEWSETSPGADLAHAVGRVARRLTGRG